MKHLSGFLWCLPASVLFWIVGIILWITKQIERFQVDWNNLTCLWDIKNDGWFCRVFFTGRGFGGFSWGNNILVIDSDPERWTRSVLHEEAHCLQWYIWGIFYPLVYGLVYLWIWSVQPGKHPYYDHPFERAARKRAGQLVDIPREMWRVKRWIWW